MLPPRYTKSVQVTAHEAPIKVTATYASVKVGIETQAQWEGSLLIHHYSIQEGQDETRAVKEMGPGETHLFGEISENMGTWTAVRKISQIKWVKTIINVFINCLLLYKELRVVMWCRQGWSMMTARVFTAVSTTNYRQISASLFTRENKNLSTPTFKVPSGTLNFD